MYTDFVYCIRKNSPGLKEELRAFGTGGEKPLEQSSSERFPSSVKLRCMSHFRNNVKDHLKALEYSYRTEITNQIFGLVDAEAPEMFDTLFESVRTT